MARNWNVLLKKRAELVHLIGQADKLCQLLPHFKRVNWLRRWAERKLSSIAPQHIVKSEIKTRIWQTQRRCVYDAAQFILYEPCWQKISNFQTAADLVLRQLRDDRVLADDDFPQAGSSDGELGSEVPFIRDSLQVAIDILDDVLKTRTERYGYHDEVYAWMERNNIRRVEDAARELGVSESKLKSIMSNKGKKRYGDSALDDVLQKIGAQRQQV